MSFGLDANGFTRKRQPDIIDEMYTDIESQYGPIDRTTRGIINQSLGVNSEREALIWELAEAAYLAGAAETAEGASLDNVASLRGLTRVAAAESTAVIAATGTEATSVPAATQLSDSATGDIFETDSTVAITIANAIRVDIDVDGVDNSALYRITIDAVNYDYTSDGTATAQEIVDGLIAALLSGSAPMVGTDDGSGTFHIISSDEESGYSVAVSAGGAGSLSITARATPIPVTAQQTGRVLVGAGSIDTIVTPVAGLASVTNIGDGVIGRDTEDDAELRIRITQAKLGTGNVEAIRSRLLNDVDGVSTVLVIENRTDSVVAGQPAHSIHCIVQGGADQDIADKIWEVKPAGIETYGSETETVVDSQGSNQTIYFSRPTPQYAHVRVTVTPNPEETVPSGAEDAIKNAILEYGNTFAIGQDMLWQGFIGPIFAATTGIKSVQMELDVTPNPGDSPSYVVDTDVAIGNDELAAFDLTRIFVLGV
jgi:uncharacterized phage protein gp47/JayE